LAKNQNFVLSSERMWHFNKIHLNPVAFSITTFVVFFGICSLEGVKLVHKLKYQGLQKGQLGSTLSSSYKVLIYNNINEFFVHLGLIKV
jgi:hypothetical protein